MAEGQDSQIAIWNLNNMLESTFAECNSNEAKFFLTGDNNFRYEIYPEYKANRRKIPKPEYLQLCKDFLVSDYGAEVSQGCEADDLIGIESSSADSEFIIVSIDKDLDQLSGWHWNPRKKIRYLVSPNDGLRFFYYQLLVGDTADGIKGAIGIGPKKAKKILDGPQSEEEILEACLPYYSCWEEIQMNANCLWLWRKENEKWSDRLSPALLSLKDGFFNNMLETGS